MDELLLFAGLIAIFTLVVMPILVMISLSRSRRNERELAQLKQTVAMLQQKLAKWQRGETGSSGKPEIDLPAVSSVRADESPVHNELPPAPVAQPVAHAASVTVSAGSAKLSQPEQASPQIPSQPRNRQPDMFTGMFSTLLAWFMKGNPLAKLGVLLMFFGLAYLLKYTVERDMLPIELRLAGAALASLVMLALGWRLRIRQQLYALILQGGAVGALYITVFGAFRLYDLLPHLLAFALMLVICAASVGLAVLQRALSLAMLASIGGYLSPLLLSTGGGSHIALFSYYLLLSLGILAIAVWQPWRQLNLLGFAFSFGVAGLWGINNYLPQYYLSCQLFLIANMVIFGVLSLGLSLRTQVKGEKVIDGVLLFGPPLIGFGMQYHITLHWAFGPAFSALGFGLAYLLLAWVGLRRFPSLGRQLAISGLALGSVFTTLAIPLALSAQWTSMAWALEGLGILWLGQSQRQSRVSYSGTGLLLLALGSALTACFNGIHALSFSLIFAVLALTWLGASWLWREANLLVSRILLGGGTCCWLAALTGGLAATPLPDADFLFPLAGLIALSALIWHLGSRRLGWSDLAYMPWLLWPAMLLVLLYQLIIDNSLLVAGWFNLVWLPVLAIAYGLLKREEGRVKPYMMQQGLHLSLFWMLLAAGTEVWHLTQRLPWGMDEWRIAALMGFIALIILLLLWAVRRGVWPFAAHQRLYTTLGLLPLAPCALILLLSGNLHDGVMIDWHYLPLLNPLEEGALLLMFALLMWGSLLRNRFAAVLPWSNAALRISGLVLLFWWGNGLVMRLLAYYSGIDWQPAALWSSRLVQTTFALLWMLNALIIMLWSTRRGERRGWFGGAGLLGVVIVKLILVDSANGGGLARAVGFIGVAILVLIAGYFSPLPPKTGHKDGSVTANEGKHEE
ncbi:DUF2339 domain-containing protein [Erwinia sorbitola]|uniref:DUF2339 domain-containing protein n=1 Tax=Erwinia sorbitola TaxID=2681984 RepID=A0A6I6EF62_9GAMM|nr:DUF2339 domain-containing protein [Erwinia sorbitola]MTD28410.1 DUF2339 domain-containing protein [Erwinia sorbitola]QGU86525.1 DUF2339 domain-containing protein [Erwinia sorbitola]